MNTASYVGICFQSTFFRTLERNQRVIVSIHNIMSRLKLYVVKQYFYTLYMDR